MIKIIILGLTLIACGGCKALKQCAPNSWNATFYQPTTPSQGGQMVGIGVSGALPWGKQ